MQLPIILSFVTLILQHKLWLRSEEHTSELRPFGKEGFENAEWIIIDYTDVVVHVFYKEKRYFYQLEDLWHDAAIKKVS